MSTRGDTFHILSGHVSVANTNNALTSITNANKQSYKYDKATHAINKYVSQGSPNVLAQTFQVNSRSTSSPLDISPVMMLR